MLAVLQSAVATVLEVDPASVEPTLRFVEDLRADSLALVEIVEAVEEQIAAQEAGFAIADEDLDDFLTVGDALAYAVARLAAAPTWSR